MIIYGIDWKLILSDRLKKYGLQKEEEGANLSRA